jgi:predicted site-specific integrase-resolvase
MHRDGKVSPRWVANKLGVGVDTVWRWCREKRLVVTETATGRYLLDQEEIEEIASNPRAWRERSREKLISNQLSSL